ncbi:hypothetical protein DRP53_03645 [candidate division WOR-3 bacterium]|uniref:Uncharacterized protein n=1 Tax=candidate division WOR-3 bacterium TaxID=2052148 RepID=A0A660SJ75_UNCW3|nr:MAG: hypothetical protein DRP53_03645 [candidate division WOR-3 bacterium]
MPPVIDPLINSYLKRTSQGRFSSIKRISFIFVVLTFLSGAGIFFFKVYNYLLTFNLFGQSLIFRIMENLLLIFFFMILFSNFLTAMTTYFRSPEVELLFSLPLRPERVLRLRFLETGLYASWASLTVVIPMLLSYGVVIGFGMDEAVLILIAVLLYTGIGAALGSLLLLILLKLFPGLGNRFSIAAIILGGILAYLYFWFGKPQLFRVFELSTELELARFIEDLGEIGSIYLPSNWLAFFIQRLFSSQSWLIYLALLFFTGLALYLILIEFGQRFYREIWLKQREFVTGRVKTFSRLLGQNLGRTMAIVAKDIIIFFRNPTQWVQLLIFSILMLIYIFSIYRSRFLFSSPFWKAVIGFANFAYVAFLFATLGVRFIYPSISTEGRCFLLMKAMPMRIRTLLFAKLIIYATAAIIIGELLMLTTSLILSADPGILRISLVVIGIAIFTIVAINLGIGCIIPDFAETNPSKLAAGGGGVIAGLACLAYTFLIIALFARPLFFYLRGNPAQARPLFLISLLIFILLSFSISLLAIKIGSRRLAGTEF